MNHFRKCIVRLYLKKYRNRIFAYIYYTQFRYRREKIEYEIFIYYKRNMINSGGKSFYFEAKDVPIIDLQSHRIQFF